MQPQPRTTKWRCISCLKALRGGQSLTFSMAGTLCSAPLLSACSTQWPCLKLQGEQSRQAGGQGSDRTQ